MKKVKVWAIFTKRGALFTINSQLPIFWFKSAADRVVINFKECHVERVKIEITKW